MGAVMKIRVSLGTLIALGAEKGRMEEYPGLAYVMQYSKDGCLGTCTFCVQSRLADSSKDFLSRVIWPVRELDEVAILLKDSGLVRVCLQTVMKPGFVEEAHTIVKTFHEVSKKPVSLSITPVPRKELERFREEGVDYLGVGLDAASERIARAVRKPYSWKIYWSFIEDGIEVFGKGRVVTHLIVGLGETYGDLLNTVQRLRDIGSDVSLFAFTPVRGTPLEGSARPDVRYYRFAQLATYIIMKGYDWREFVVEVNGVPYIKSEFINDVESVIHTVLTRGCPGCNRPFYNEPPGREPYNFPSASSVNSFHEVLVREIKDILM